jgi:hypothetical protein
MLLEVYESFRKESAIARADAGLDDDESGFSPDEAALTWPENLTPALAARPRRLAIAAYREAGDDEDADEDDDVVSLLRHGHGPWDAATGEDPPEDDDLSSLSGDGLSEGDVPEADADRPGADQSGADGGTVHQFPSPAHPFPPPAGNG